MIWLFLVLWALLFGAVLFMIAATPTTVQTPNSALIAPAIWTGIASVLITLCAAGVLSLFS